MGYTLLNRDDPSIESFRGAFFKIRRALGTTAFGINEVRLPAGAEGLEHDEVETGHEEVYIVLEGGGTFTVDGEAVDVGAGDYLRVDRRSEAHRRRRGRRHHVRRRRRKVTARVRRPRVPVTAIVGLHHVQVAAPPGCEDAARAFYGGLLGLPEIEKPPAARRSRGMLVRASEMPSCTSAWRSPSDPRRRRIPALLVDSADVLEGLATSLAAAGVEVDVGRRRRDPGPAALPRE